MATSIAELVKWQEWRLVEVHMPQHHGPVAIPGLSCNAASRFVLAVPVRSKVQTGRRIADAL
jgi:hypothetical protein